jgi:hypothetical protein
MESTVPGTPAEIPGLRDPRLELLQGTLDLLILQTLRPGPTHGHAIAKSIQRSSDDVLLERCGVACASRQPHIDSCSPASAFPLAYPNTLSHVTQ